MAYCTECGQALEERDRFCAQCGTKVRRPSPASEPPPAIPDRPVDPVRLAPPVGTDELGPPQYGSMLRSAAELSPNISPAKNERPAWLIVSGAATLILLGAAAGYWWFVRPDVTGAASAVDPALAAASQPGGETGAAVADAHATGGGWRVVETFTGAVQHPAAAAGVPDGQIAVIPPGETLALEWTAGEFYNGEGPDVRVVGRQGARARYTIFARTDPAGPWVRFDINTRGFPAGAAAHDFGHHGITEAREVLIRNEGAGNLDVDAVVPLYTEPQAHAEESDAHGDGR
ncbi:MAG: zinc-ribbon domain-containing protein [Acidobacteria bacterium]|nr:zinc-ribbon domain-containing protein [Acidobacteriota bacterium]